MLIVKVPISEEGFDNQTQKFVEPEYFELELEHSLVSLSKWEQKHEKPFLSDDKKTPEETLDYIKCMVLTTDVPSDLWSLLTQKNLDDINAYVNAKMTATWFNETKSAAGGRQIITSELIYYWLVALQIDFQCQYWHLNRLITLVKVCNHQNQPPKKMNKRELMQKHRDLNEQRRRQAASAQ